MCMFSAHSEWYVAMQFVGGHGVHVRSVYVPMCVANHYSNFLVLHSVC